MVVNKLVWAPRIHGLFARYEIIDLISIIMFSDCYQMRTRTTIQHSYIILTFNTCVFALISFFVVGFLCSVSSSCLEPCILGQRVKAPFWRLWRVAPIAWLDPQKKKTPGEADGFGEWLDGQWLPLRPGGRGAGCFGFSSRGGAFAASCLKVV